MQSLTFAAVSPAQEVVPPRLLEPGIRLQREIGGSAVHAYSLALLAGQFVRVHVNQQGIDVLVTVSDGRGKSISVDRPNAAHGREAVSYLAERDGTYSLEVRSFAKAAVRGQYAISVEELRPATARDASRLVAERALSEGTELYVRKSADSLPRAVEQFNQALALWRALDDRYEEAITHFGLCLVHRLLGDSESGVKTCGASLAIMRDISDRHGEARARTGRAWSYFYLGDAEKSLADFSAALALNRELGEREQEAFCLFGIGWAHTLNLDHAQAIAHFRQSLRVQEEIGDGRGLAIRLAAIGEVSRRMGEYGEAEAHLTKALALMRAGDERRALAETLTNVGWTRYALERLEASAEAFNEALVLRRQAGDVTGEAITLLGLANVERKQGNLHNARGHVEAALRIIESLRDKVADTSLRSSYLAATQDYYEFYIDLLMQLHRLDAAGNFAAAALEAAERARARSLLDMLNEASVDVRQGVPAELLEQERTLRAQLNTAANVQRAIPGEANTPAKAAAAARTVQELTRQLSETEARIRRASPAYAALTQSQPLDAAAIQREVLDSDTVLLEYAMGRRRSFLWAVTPHAINAYELPPRAEIETAAAQLRAALAERSRSTSARTTAERRSLAHAADRRFQGAAANLSRMLLAPAAAQLKAKRLLIVAPGALQYVPFGALPIPAAKQGRRQNLTPLIAEHEIVTLPSSSTLAMLRRTTAGRTPAPKEIIIFADPIFSADDERLPRAATRRAQPAPRTATTPNTETLFSRPATVLNGDSRTNANPISDASETATELESQTLPRLFRTRWEANQIAALTEAETTGQRLDFAANYATATGPELNQYRIVHFATHALINDTHPELSGIALSMFDRDGQPRNGFLRLHDIFNLKLSADLVVLSACRTALGKDFKGEGLVGFTRGFMYAGAPRVIGSLWSLDDKATAELMVRFYRQMLKENLRPAAALRAAQLEMWKDQRWHAPYFWAGFTLQGEWR